MYWLESDIGIDVNGYNYYDDDELSDRSCCEAIHQKFERFLGSIFAEKQTKCIPGEKLGIIYCIQPVNQVHIEERTNNTTGI